MPQALPARIKDFRFTSGLAAWILAALLPLLLFLLFPYAQGYGSRRVPMARQWFDIIVTDESWQHCWIVLPLAVFLIWKSRANMLLAAKPSHPSSLIFVLVALLFFVAGYRVQNYYAGFLSLHLLLVGLIIWFWGYRATVVLAFPLLFLFFFWPFLFFDSMVAFPLRMLMSRASAFVLNLLGVPVILQGTGLLSAPDAMMGLPAGKKFSVDVADPCSGIRSLFALMMVSALYAHFTLNTWWKKWILFLCSAPLAIAGNLVRILALTLGTVAFGAEFAIGKNALTEPSWFHMGAGYLVFAVALGGMIGIGWLLNGGAVGIAARLRTLAGRSGPRPQQPPPPANNAGGPPSRTGKRQDIY